MIIYVQFDKIMSVASKKHFIHFPKGARQTMHRRRPSCNRTINFELKTQQFLRGPLLNL